MIGPSRRRVLPAFALAAILCTGLALWSCAERRTGAAIAPAPVEELPILWEEWGQYSRLSHGARLVIRDRATLSQVPITEVPVDFASQMVLVAALGPTPNPELGVRIRRVWRQDGEIRVTERFIHPGSTDGAPPRRASPWTIVVVPRSADNVRGYSSHVPDSLLGDYQAPNRNN
jgi:hypothetical protein